MLHKFWRIAKYNTQKDEIHVLGALCTFIWGPPGTLVRLCREELTNKQFDQFDIWTYTPTDTQVRMANCSDPGNLAEILKSRVRSNGTPPMQIPSRRNKLEWRLLPNPRGCLELPRALSQKPPHSPVWVYAAQGALKSPQHPTENAAPDHSSEVRSILLFPVVFLFLFLTGTDRNYLKDGFASKPTNRKFTFMLWEFSHPT